MRPCEGCGMLGEKVEYMDVRVTNGVLHLCRQCLDDVNRKNPELKAMRFACKEAMRILTAEAEAEWQESQFYEEAPYHFLWVAINAGGGKHEGS